MNDRFCTMNEAIEKGGLLNEINIKLHDYPFLLLDDAIETPSVNNWIKEFSGGEPVWEDESDEDMCCLERLSNDDLANVLYEIERQIEKDDKLMDRCRSDW